MSHLLKQKKVLFQRLDLKFKDKKLISVYCRRDLKLSVIILLFLHDLSFAYFMIYIISVFFPPL